MNRIHKILLTICILFSFFYINSVTATLAELTEKLEVSFLQKNWQKFATTQTEISDFLSKDDSPEIPADLYFRRKFAEIKAFLEQDQYEEALQVIKSTTEKLLGITLITSNSQTDELAKNIYKFLKYPENKCYPEIDFLILFLVEYFHAQRNTELAFSLVSYIFPTLPYLQDQLLGIAQNTEMYDWTPDIQAQYRSIFIKLLKNYKMLNLLNQLEDHIFDANWGRFNELAVKLDRMTSDSDPLFFRFKFLSIRGCLAQRLYNKAYLHIQESAEILFGKKFEAEDDTDDETDELVEKLTKDVDSAPHKIRSKWHSLMFFLAEYYIYTDRFEKSECLLLLLYRFAPYLQASTSLLLGDLEIFRGNPDSARNHYLKAYDKAKNNRDAHYILGHIYIGCVKADLIQPNHTYEKTRGYLKRAKHHFIKDKFELGEALVKFYTAYLDFKQSNIDDLVETIGLLEDKFLSLQDPFYWGLTLLFEWEQINKEASADDANLKLKQKLTTLLTAKSDEDIPLLKRLILEKLPLLIPENLLAHKKTHSPRSFGSLTASPRSSNSSPRSSTLSLSGKRRGSGETGLERADSSTSSTASTSLTSPRDNDSPSLSRASSKTNLNNSPIRYIPGTRVHTLATSGEY